MSKPETTIQDGVVTSRSMKPLDSFKETEIGTISSHYDIFVSMVTEPGKPTLTKCFFGEKAVKPETTVQNEFLTFLSKKPMEEGKMEDHQPARNLYLSA